VSVRGLEELCSRLSSEERATLRWSPTTLRSALGELLHGDLNDAAIEQAAQVLTGVMFDLAPMLESHLTRVGALRSEFQTLWSSDVALLKRVLGEAAADSAEWALRAWAAVVEASMSGAVDVALPRFATEVEQLINAKLYVQTLIMAVLEGARDGAPLARLEELAYRAYDLAQLMMERAARAGLSLDPFRGETAAERGARIRRYARHVRAVLTDDDVRDLTSARLGSLR
jgi:hypothetical protein